MKKNLQLEIYSDEDEEQQPEEYSQQYDHHEEDLLRTDQVKPL